MLAGPDNMLTVLNQIVTGDSGIMVDTPIITQPIAKAATVVTDAEAYWVVPRDFDLQSNELDLRILAVMGGASDTPAITLDVTRLRGSSALVTAQAIGTVTNAGLDATVNLDGLDIVPGDVLLFAINIGAHGTDALTIQAANATYRSTVAAYEDSSR